MCAVGYNLQCKLMRSSLLFARKQSMEGVVSENMGHLFHHLGEDTPVYP